MALSTTCLWSSLDVVRPYLRLRATDVGDDEILTLLAESVSEELERETGRIFVTRTIMETLDGPGTPILRLRGYPSVVITSFTEDGVAVDSSSYVLDATGGLICRKTGSWGTGQGQYAVTYTAGYARSALPELVLQVAGDLLRARYLSWSTNADVFSYQAQAGGGVVQPFADWVSIRKQLLTLRYEHRVGVA